MTTAIIKYSRIFIGTALLLAACGSRPSDAISAGAVDGVAALAPMDVMGGSEIDDFNSYAKTAALWTSDRLSARTREFLGGLSPRAERAGFTLVHASPRDEVWEYIDSIDVARDNFALFNSPYCLFGHTHRARAYGMDAAGNCIEKLPAHSEALPLAGQRMLLNPGSVGQPRDRNPNAAYALLDVKAGTWEARRVAYPIADTQAQMRAAQLPTPLIERLDTGR